LFHDDDTQPFDLGDKTLNCGRRQDSFKAWLSWKVHGTKGFADRVDTCFANTLRFVELLKAKPEAFEVLFEPEFCQVCFLYVMLLLDLLYPSLSLSLSFSLLIHSPARQLPPSVDSTLAKEQGARCTLWRDCSNDSPSHSDLGKDLGTATPITMAITSNLFGLTPSFPRG